MSNWLGTAEFAALTVAFAAGARYLYTYYNGDSLSLLCAGVDAVVNGCQLWAAACLCTDTLYLDTHPDLMSTPPPSPPGAPQKSFSYVPFSDAFDNDSDVVAVDCTHPRLRTLSHQRGARNPANGLRPADTSTGLVLNALAAGPWKRELFALCQRRWVGRYIGTKGCRGLRVRSSACSCVHSALLIPLFFDPLVLLSTPTPIHSFVTTNHFDVDSFLAVWCYINRAQALEHEGGESPAPLGSHAGQPNLSTLVNWAASP
jgi:hypothetical protein